MASPASIGRHPVHPMFIPFPIALWVFSLVADVIYLWRGNPIWRNYVLITISGWLVGELVLRHGVAVDQHSGRCVKWG